MPTRTVQRLARIRWPTLSPDGKWLAYGATVEGAATGDVYVQPWPALDRKWKISTDGGGSPAWTKGGRELLFTVRRGRDSIGVPFDDMMSVDVGVGPEFTSGTPRKLFTAPSLTATPVRKWDVTPDGSRIIGSTLRPVHAPAGDIHVLVNWMAAFPDLSRRAAR